MSLARHKHYLMNLFRQINDLRTDPIGQRLTALSIQEELLKRRIVSERTIRAARRTLKSVAAQLSDRSNAAHSKRLKRSRALLQARIELHKTLLTILADVADSIAFIYLDRFNVKQFAFRESAGFISGKAGAALERRLLRELFREGHIALLNDLTTSLRHGDITVLAVNDVSLDLPIIFEVKSGTVNRSRLRRQIDAAEHVFAYLKTDEKSERGIRFKRDVPVGAPPNYGPLFTRLISAAASQGFAVGEPEAGLRYVVGSTTVNDSTVSEIVGTHVAGPERAIYMVNDMKGIAHGYYPFPLSIVDPEALFHFYNGDVVGIVVIVLELLNERLAAHGLKVEHSGNADRPLSITQLDSSKGIAGSVTIGSHLLGRIAAEFVGLDWISANIVSLCQTLDRQTNAYRTAQNERERL